jgi:hypothetical protein
LAKKCRGIDEIMEQPRKYLVEHPIFKNLGGRPMALSMIASQTMSFSLSQLFTIFLSTDQSLNMDIEDKERPLILSLEILMKNL